MITFKQFIAEAEEVSGVLSEVKFVPVSELTLQPGTTLRQQWDTIHQVMKDSGQTEEEWAEWWLKGNKQPLDVVWEKRHELMLIDGHHRYIAYKILNRPARVKIRYNYIPAAWIPEMIQHLREALKEMKKK